MKRIAVTGSRGGTGSGIAAVLRDAGYEVLGIDRVPPDQSDLDSVTGVASTSWLDALADP